MQSAVYRKEVIAVTLLMSALGHKRTLAGGTEKKCLPYTPNPELNLSIVIWITYGLGSVWDDPHAPKKVLV